MAQKPFFQLMRENPGIVLTVVGIAFIVFLIGMYNIAYGSNSVPAQDTERESTREILKQLIEKQSGKNLQSGETSKYQWQQTEEEISIALPVDGATTSRDVVLTVKQSSLKLQVAKEIVLEGELCGNVCPEESYWQFEGNGSNREIQISLVKKDTTKKGLWRGVMKADAGAAPAAGPEIHAVDTSDPAAIGNAVEQMKDLRRRKTPNEK